MKEYIKNSYLDISKLLSDFINEQKNIDLTFDISKEMAKSFLNGNKLLICGNGGSACDAMHFSEEFTGKYRKERKPLPVIHLMDPAYLTCVANDYGFDEVFKRGVEAFGKKGDWLISLSTSGNSENVLRACNKAKELGVKTLALLGKADSKISSICDYEFIVPGETSDRIQEIHMIILHIIIEGIERELFPKNY